MKLVVNGTPEMFPADWRLHIATEGQHTRITVERYGKFIPLAEALAVRDTFIRQLTACGWKGDVVA